MDSATRLCELAMSSASRGEREVGGGSGGGGDDGSRVGWLKAD